MSPLLPFAVFALATSVTPGPNNVMIAAGAAMHGARAVVPMSLGIAGGFAAMVLIVGLGLAVPLAHAPIIRDVARWIAIVWLLWLAWKIATAPPPGSGDGSRPLGFVGGALFQWINPKAWMLALSTATAWTLPEIPAIQQMPTLAMIFFIICVPSCLLWAWAGAAAGRWLSSPKRVRVFNVTMAVLLVLSMVPVALGE